MTYPFFKLVDIENLSIGFQSPRISQNLNTESDIIKYFVLEHSITSLMMSIGENGFSPIEPLVVYPINDFEYEVIDGNRRLIASKILNNQSIVDVNANSIAKIINESKVIPKAIPCLIFQNKEDILIHLGYKHISNNQTWLMLKKARYIFHLYQSKPHTLSFEEKTREIAKSIGTRRQYVNKFLLGFEIYKVIEENTFFRIKDLNDKTLHFNYILESLNYDNICQFLGINSVPFTSKINLVNLEKWTKWFFEKDSLGRVKVHLDTIYELNMILENKVNLEKFDNGIAINEIITCS